MVSHPPFVSDYGYVYILIVLDLSEAFHTTGNERLGKKMLILNKCSVDFTSVPKLTLTLQSQTITAQGSVFSLLLFSLEHIVPSIIFGMASPILLFVLYTENIWRLDQKMVDF